MLQGNVFSDTPTYQFNDPRRCTISEIKKDLGVISLRGVDLTGYTDWLPLNFSNIDLTGSTMYVHDFLDIRKATGATLDKIVLENQNCSGWQPLSKEEAYCIINDKLKELGLLKTETILAEGLIHSDNRLEM